MKLLDLFEAQTEWMMTPYGGGVEVFENPSNRDVSREIFNSENLDGEYGARGFWVPAMLTSDNRDFYAIWSANLLHPDVVEKYGYVYTDVIKFYVEPRRFVIYYYARDDKTGREIKELLGGTKESLINHMMQVRGLRFIMKGKEISFEDYA
tara:strand:+ start:3793 stop:4245 length:453 start_codon:yes stop_codon:yes gene_type:complete